MSTFLNSVMSFFGVPSAQAKQRAGEADKWYRGEQQRRALADAAWNASTVGQAANAPGGVPALHVAQPRTPVIEPIQPPDPLPDEPVSNVMPTIRRALVDGKRSYYQLPSTTIGIRG